MTSGTREVTEVREQTLPELIAARRAAVPRLRDDPYRWLRSVVRRGRQKARRRWFQHVVKGRLGINHVRNWVTDRRYGGFSGGASGSNHIEEGALGYSAVDYEQLDKIFTSSNGLEIAPDDVLVDIGCGKGRVINWWLGRRLGNRIYGLELEEELADHARRRLARWPNVSIITGDALANLPADATLMWMFNPFWVDVVARFKERLVEVYGLESAVRIVYFMPLFERIFADDPRFVVDEVLPKPIYRCVIIRFAGAPEHAEPQSSPPNGDAGT